MTDRDEIEALAADMNRFPDEFNGDDAKLIACIEALLSLDAKNALVPHGIGGHARGLLSAAMHRLACRLTAPQPGAAVPEGMSLLVDALEGAMIESLHGEGFDLWAKNRGKLRNRLPENVGAIVVKMRALLAAPAPEASKCGPACARCGSTTGAACSDHGCHYLTAGNGAPEAERAKGEEPENDWRLRGYAYASKQATSCAQCGEYKHTPLRIDAMGGYVCLTCIDKKLGSLLGEFGYPETPPPVGQPDGVDDYERIYAVVIKVCADQPMADEIATRLASAPQSAGSEQQGDSAGSGMGVDHA